MGIQAQIVCSLLDELLYTINHLIWIHLCTYDICYNETATAVSPKSVRRAPEMQRSEGFESRYSVSGQV